jgi:hypothetical protein
VNNNLSLVLAINLAGYWQRIGWCKLASITLSFIILGRWMYQRLLPLLLAVKSYSSEKLHSAQQKRKATNLKQKVTAIRRISVQG